MPYPITKRNGKYYVNGHGYRTRGEAVAYQRALYAHAPESEKAAVNPAYQRGITEESGEHPELPPEIIAQLVRDHLKIDPNYYAEEEKFNPNHDADTGRFATGDGGGGGSGSTEQTPGNIQQTVTPTSYGHIESYHLSDSPESNLDVVYRKSDGRRAIASAYIPESERGKGKGQQLYLHALSNGPIIAKQAGDDNFSKSAQRVHDALIKKGYAKYITDEYGVKMLEITPKGKQQIGQKALVDAAGQSLHGPQAANASLYGPLSAPGVAPGKRSTIIRPITKRPKQKKAYKTPQPLPWYKRMGQKLKEGISLTHGGDGLRYLFIITSNSYKDREDETITTKALQDYVDQQWGQGDISQPLRWWHDDTLPDIGKVVWADMEGPFLIELAQELPTALSKAVFDYLEENPQEKWAASHGFDFPEEQKDADGTYKRIFKFETSLLPLKAAANPYTLSAVIGKEGDMSQRDEVLDKILKVPGAAAKLRKGIRQMKDTLDEQGLKPRDKSLKRKGVMEEAGGKLDEVKALLSDDPNLAQELLEFMMDLLGGHAEPDADELGMEEEALEPEAEPEVEGEPMEAEPLEEDEKAQPGYAEMEPNTSEQLVNQAITKKPGTFPKPVSHQVETGKGKKRGKSLTQDDDLITAIKALNNRLETVEAALGELADMPEQFKALQERDAMTSAWKAFSPRQASASEATIVDDPEVVKKAKQLNSAFDPFWGGVAPK